MPPEIVLTQFKPDFDVRIRRPIQTDAITEEPDKNKILGFISHRLNLRPTVGQAQQEPHEEHEKQPNDSIYAGRKEGTAFLYRKSAFSRNAKLVYGSYGHTTEKAYQVPTRWAVMHPFAALSFVTRTGEWWVAQVAAPTENPPKRLTAETLAAGRRDKSQLGRPVQVPARVA